MTDSTTTEVERDDLAPIQRIRIIASLLAEAVLRRRADMARSGAPKPHAEASGEGLEPSAMSGLDRSRG